ncbi:MAG: hypothetical protein MZV49_25940 [Rhodopseudomonas palustris]|nr:hypothetical protein [Rhodopseudomonas palustris]
MLAYLPANQASYDPGLTLLSLALAVLVIGAGAAIALIGPSICTPPRAAPSSVSALRRCISAASRRSKIRC